MISAVWITCCCRGPIASFALLSCPEINKVK